MPDEPATGSTIRRGEARERILQAAASVIAHRGVRQMRIEDVARAAGISNGLLYYHFGDRSGLVRAALEHANAQAPSTLDSVVGDGTDGVRSRLVAALLAELDEAPQVRNNSVVWNEVSASAIFDPALREALGRVTDDWNAKVVRAVEAAVADGSARAPGGAADAAEYLTTMIEGLSLRWLAGTMTLDRAREHLRAAVEHVLPGTAE
ncbi:TetR/AcrR family transcriptional regulator [Patulibacter sp.]|uniref:TetR/AcrR family transcriptional regulator n=1 Tax=Patulibacter sp. TaxID=1912859 RepID=UPI002726D49D|nr:TetR/AcrR family transcriptional regulator [Patulibacter sp.]MDO9410856.1 TetR/AcrR family transcriptional regulator [Patulibacter sp.]